MNTGVWAYGREVGVWQAWGGRAYGDGVAGVRDMWDGVSVYVVFPP